MDVRSLLDHDLKTRAHAAHALLRNPEPPDPEILLSYVVWPERVPDILDVDLLERLGIYPPIDLDSPPVCQGFTKQGKACRRPPGPDGYCPSHVTWKTVAA